MKRMMKLLTVSIFITTVGFVNAQSQKFGHINLNSLIQVMPERANAEAELSNLQKEMEDILTEMQQGYQNSLEDLEQMEEDVSKIKRDAKIDELQNIQQRIQNYKLTAQQQIQKKYEELLKPVYDKAIVAIEKVAKEHELLYVFDTSSNVVLYKSNQSMDLMPFVRKELNIE